MQSLRVRFISLTICALLLTLPTGIILGAHCIASKIVIVAGPWEEDSTKTSYTVQAQDESGSGCHVTQTLRLSFASSGSGTFIGQTGSVVQAWIASGSANRNFYYQHAAGENATLTIKAGYGAADDWSVLWEVSHNIGESLSDGQEGVASGTVAPTASAGQQTIPSQSSPTISSAKGTSGAKSSTEAKPRVFADDPLRLVLSHPRRVSVGQPVIFAATPSGLEVGELQTLRYSWNFGDGATGVGRTPSHIYTHPGTYVVMGSASRQGHEIVIRTEITATALQVEFGRNDTGDLVIRNTASNEIEISGFAVKSGTRRFSIPDYTYLLPKASLALSPTRTGFSLGWSEASIYDREGIPLARYPAEEAYEEDVNAAEIVEEAFDSTATFASSTPDASAEISTPASGDAATTTDQTDDSPIALAQEEGERDPPFEQAAAAGASGGWGWPASLGFIGALLVGIASLYVHKIV